MEKIFKALRLSFFINWVKNIFIYHSECTKKIYACKLLNEYNIKSNGSIELKIKQFGGGNLIIIEASDLFKNEYLMQALNPYDVAKVSFITLGRYLSKFNEIDREEAFEEILKKIMKG